MVTESDVGAGVPPFLSGYHHFSVSELKPGLTDMNIFS